MLNLTLFYFVILGLYHLAKIYIPKIYQLFRVFARMSKHHPLIFMSMALSIFIISHPEREAISQTILGLSNSSRNLESISKELTGNQSSSTEIFLTTLLARLLALQLPLP
jgi:hypothetical protein